MQIILYTVDGKVHYNLLNTGNDQILDHEIPAWEDAAEVMYKMISNHPKHVSKIRHIFANAPINSIDFGDFKVTRIKSGTYYDVALRSMFVYVYDHFFGGPEPLPYDDLHMKCNIGQIINSVYDKIEMTIV